MTLQATNWLFLTNIDDTPISDRCVYYFQKNTFSTQKILSNVRNSDIGISQLRDFATKKAAIVGRTMTDSGEKEKT
jgi:hypothetical protein